MRDGDRESGFQSLLSPYPELARLQSSRQRVCGEASTKLGALYRDWAHQLDCETSIGTSGTVKLVDAFLRSCSRPDLPPTLKSFHSGMQLTMAYCVHYSQNVDAVDCPERGKSGERPHRQKAVIT